MRISDIASVIAESVKNPSLSEYDRFVGLEHYESGEVEIHQWGSTNNLQSTMKKFVSGDVLLARRNVYLRRAAVVRFDGLTSGDSIVLRPKEGFEDIMPFILNTDSFWKYANEHADGTMSKRLSPELLLEYSFEIKNDDVESLAKVLWSIDEYRQSLYDLKKKTDELVKSQFIERFGTYENTIYSVKTLEDLCEPIKDGTHQTPTYTDDKENGFLFYSSKDVVTRYMDWDHPMYIPADLHEQLYKRVAPRKGDILLAKNGTTGIAAIVDRDEVFDIYVSLALLRPLPGTNVKYLWQAINMPETKRQFDARLKGIGVPNLHLGEIKKAKIVVPPIELQNEFAEFVEQSDKSKFALQQTLDALNKTYKKIIAENLG